MPPITQQQGGIGIAIPINRPPCLKFCEQVIEKSCFRYNQDLDKEWNSYVDSLVRLANRLRTSLNIESVVDPIDVRISEAIMNFQDNGDKIRQEVFQACGQPQTSHFLGLGYHGQLGGTSAQSGQRSTQPRIVSNPLPRYKRDYGSPVLQMRTRSNNRNRASNSPSSQPSVTTTPTIRPLNPSMLPSINNNHNAPSTGTITPKNSQQSIILQSSLVSSFSTTNTNNDEQKILGLIVEIRQQMNKTIGFWNRLPNNICLNKQILGSYSVKQITTQSNCYSSQLR